MAGIVEVKRWRREKRVEVKERETVYDMFTLAENNYFLNSVQIVRATPANFTVGVVTVNGVVQDSSKYTFVQVQVSDGSLQLVWTEDFKKLQA